MNPWLYNNIPFLEIPEGTFGFVYNIKNLISNRSYIGKKQFWSNRSKKVPGKKNRRHTILESDWKEYWSSSEDLKKDVELIGKDFFKREILRLCSTKRDLTFGEVELQIKNNVLTAKLENGEPAYYNKNIMSRWFIKPEITSDKTKKKISESKIGNQNWLDKHHTEESKKKTSIGNTGKIRSKEQNKKNSEAHKGLDNHQTGKIRNEETKKKIRQANLGENNPNYGKPRLEEIKKKISISNTGQKRTEEQKKNISEAHIGIKMPEFTEEHLYNMSKGISQNWKIIYPDGTEKIINGLKQFCRDENLNYKRLWSTSKKGKRTPYNGFKCFKIEDK